MSENEPFLYYDKLSKFTQNIIHLLQYRDHMKINRLNPLI